MLLGPGGDGCAARAGARGRALGVCLGGARADGRHLRLPPAPPAPTDAASSRVSFAYLGVSPQNISLDADSRRHQVWPASLWRAEPGLTARGSPQDGPVLDGVIPLRRRLGSGLLTRATCRGWRTPLMARSLGHREPASDRASRRRRRLVLQRRRPGGSFARASARQAETDFDGHARVAAGHGSSRPPISPRRCSRRSMCCRAARRSRRCCAAARTGRGLRGGERGGAGVRAAARPPGAGAAAEGREGGGRGPETGWIFITTFLLGYLDALPPERREAVLRAAAAEAAPIAARHRNWGEVHRLRAAHWLVNAPLVGRRSCSAPIRLADRGKRLRRAATGWCPARTR